MLPFDPTHFHAASFWEELGRTIGTFGFLEETLGKAIFAFTSTRPYPPDEIEEVYEKWGATLGCALTDPLYNLIGQYGKAVREHPGSKMSDKELESLIDNLRRAAVIRNVLCHGSWDKPDCDGKSLPLFVNRNKEVFDTRVDIAFLGEVRQSVNEFISDIINSCLGIGWNFPGINIPEKRME